MDSRKIKIIGATAIGVVALILLIINLVPSGPDESNTVPLTQEERTEYGNARFNPDYDPTTEPGYTPESDPVTPE